jgi:hypothetical protein
MFILSMSLISKAFAPDSIFGRDSRRVFKPWRYNKTQLKAHAVRCLSDRKRRRIGGQSPVPLGNWLQSQLVAGMASPSAEPEAKLNATWPRGEFLNIWITRLRFQQFTFQRNSFIRHSVTYSPTSLHSARPSADRYGA